MDTIRKINKYVIIGLMLLALVVSGCGIIESDEPKDYLAEGDRPIFKDSPHQSLYQLFGDISENEMKFLLQDILDNMQSATRHGDLTNEDSELILELIYLGQQMINDLCEGNNEEMATDFRDGLARTLELMAEKKVGEMMTNMFTAMATDDVDNLITYKDWESVADPEERDRQKALYDKGNLLLANLLPMLEYIVNMNFGDFEGIPLIVPESGDINVVIDANDAHKFTDALGHLMNPEGPYKEVYDQSQTLFRLTKEREELMKKRPTVGDAGKLINGFLSLLEKFTEEVQSAQENAELDVDITSITTAVRNALTALLNLYKTEEGITPESITDVVANLWFDISPESNFDIAGMEAVLGAVLELWEAEEEAFNDDTLASIYALGRLMADTSRPGHDGWTWTNEPGMTDMERILYCVRDLLNPVVQDRDSLKNFLLNAIEGAALLEGADNINGIMKGLSTVKIDDMKDIDTALYQYLMQNEINGNPRKAENPEENSDGKYSQTNMSVTRAILYMMSSMYQIADLIEGPATQALLFPIVAEKGTVNYPDLPKENLIEWMVGLMAVGMYEYPDTYLYPIETDGSDHDEYPNPLKGLDWVFYGQPIKPLNWDILKMDGLYGMLGILLDHPDLFNAIGYVVGGLTDPLPAMMEFVGSTGEEYSTGKHHKLFALVAPILKHYWDQGRALDMVEMTTYMNEISMASYKTLAWAGNDATFNTGRGVDNRLGHVLENMEGLYGYGLTYYGLRGDSADENDHNGDPLDPTLDLTVRILRKLQNTPYKNGTILDYIIASGTSSSVGEEIDPAEMINRLFEPNASGESPIDKLYGFLVENHNALALNSKAVGEVLLALHDDIEPYIKNDDDGSFSIQDIFDLLAKDGNFLDVFAAQTQNNEAREALVSMVRYILEDPDVKNAEMVQYIIEVFGIEDDEKVIDTLANLMDSGLRLLGGIIDDLQILIPHYGTLLDKATEIINDKTLIDNEKIEKIGEAVKSMLMDEDGAVKSDIKAALDNMLEVTIKEYDIDGFTDDDFIKEAKKLIGLLLAGSDTLIDDYVTLLPILLEQTKALDLPADIDTEEITEGFEKILTTVLDEIGKKSTLTDKLKIMGFKSMWMKHDEYNSAGLLPDHRITDNTPLFEALDFLLTGANRKYDMMSLFEFLNALVEEDVISIFLSDDRDTRKQSALTRELQARDVQPIISMRLIKSMYTPYDGRPSTMYLLFNAMHIQRVEENNRIETLDVNLLLSDLADIITGINLKTDGTSRLYNTLYNLINFAADTFEIQ